MAKEDFLLEHIAQLYEVLSAPPRHEDIEHWTRIAFEKARRPLESSDAVLVNSKSGIGTGLGVRVLTSSRRGIEHKQIMRLQAYLRQHFEMKRFAIAPSKYKSKPVIEFRFIVLRVKKTRTKDK